MSDFKKYQTAFLVSLLVKMVNLNASSSPVEQTSSNVFLDATEREVQEMKTSISWTQKEVDGNYHRWTERTLQHNVYLLSWQYLTVYLQSLIIF